MKIKPYIIHRSAILTPFSCDTEQNKRKLEEMAESAKKKPERKKYRFVMHNGKKWLYIEASGLNPVTIKKLGFNHLVDVYSAIINGRTDLIKQLNRSQTKEVLSLVTPASPLIHNLISNL